ncbi:MAG: apolipoprotein N-acyltransferase [Balneolaceae bacterium]|nr:MAG: apolipoprotein N-acyltransferase [Balneolaceae bacterium]
MKSFTETFWNGKYYLAVTAGILLGMSYPPFPFPFLMFPAFVLLIRLASLAESGRETAFYTYISFVIWNTIATYWLSFATVAGGISAILANAAIMTLPFLLVRYFVKSGLHPLAMAVSVASAWTIYEFLHYRWDLAWPWLSAANAFSNSVLLVQYIAYTGSLGITFWIVFTSALIYYFLATWKNQVLSYTLAAMFLPIIISLVIYYTYTDKPDKSIEVVIVQPNHDSYLELSGFSNTFDPLVEMLDLSETKISGATRLVLWPENALLSNVHENRPRSNDMYILNRVREWGVPLITGAALYRYYEPGYEPPVYRTYNDSQRFNIYNAAVKFDTDGSISSYGKGKLVPIVERIPFVEQLQHIPVPGVDWAGISGFGRGQETTVFKIDDTFLPAVICYDSVFPDWVRRFVKQGSGVITVITNDGWWGNTSGHIQHYDFARLRAIENRRAVIRSANNGISGMILSNGDVHSKTVYWTRDVLAIDVPVYSHLTFYTRYGDLIGYFCMLGLIPGFISRKKS